VFTPPLRALKASVFSVWRIGTEAGDRAPTDERRWLLGLALITACSWGRWAATGSVKVDENYPSEVAGTALFLVLLAGWALLVAGWHGMLLRPPPAPRRLAFVGLGVASLMLPMISNDVFSVFAYASLAARGRDVYTTAAALPESPWFGWIGEHWNTKVCVYGPTTLLAALPSALGGQNPWLALLLTRVTWLLPLAAVMELSFRRLGERPFFHAMVWLNPLWIVEGPGQLHADLLGATAVVAGVVLGAGGRWKGGAALWAVAVLGKWSFAFAAPWFWLRGARTAREALLRLPVVAAVVLALGAVVYAPFWRGVSTLTEPVHALASMNPGGSITEVVGTIVHVLRGGGIPAADAPVELAIELDRQSHATTWLVVSLVLRLVALGVGLSVLRDLRRAPGNEEQLALGTGVLVVAAVTLASHRFQAWYLMTALPFFGLRCPEPWRRWWVAVVAVSVTTEFVYVLPRTAWLLPPWVAVTTAVTVILFLVSFRARFLRPSHAPGSAATISAGDGARPAATTPAGR
jgi:hypothetical protein